MASLAVFGKGTSLQVESATPGSYETIPECRNIRPPNPDREQLDATSHDSAGAAREFKGGLVDFGEVTADCLYIPSNSLHQQAIADAIASASVARKYRVLLTGSARSVDFDGYMQRFERTMPHDALYTASLSIKVTGQPVENDSP